MDIEILEESKKKLRFKMFHSRYSIPEMLKKQLLNYKEVVMASGMLKHPEDNDSEFVLVVKTGNPRAILEKAINELQKDLNSFKEEMLKAIPDDAKDSVQVKSKSKKTTKKKTKAKKTK